MVKLTLFLSLNFIKTKIKPICNEPNISYDMNLTWSRYVDGKFNVWIHIFLPSPHSCLLKKSFCSFNLREMHWHISVKHHFYHKRPKLFIFRLWHILKYIAFIVDHGPENEWKLKIVFCIIIPYFYEWKGWLISGSM